MKEYEKLISISPGSSNALIGVTAVDRAAYFLFGSSRLTRQSVFEGLSQYDEGCVREGGKNAQHVFEVIRSVFISIFHWLAIDKSLDIQCYSFDKLQNFSLLCIRLLLTKRDGQLTLNPEAFTQVNLLGL